MHLLERHWGDGDPTHPILPESHKYEIVGLRLELDPVEAAEPYLDLTVRRGADRRVLRFWSPVDLRIEEGGPRMTHGLAILDVRSRQLEGIGVRVDDFEGSSGSVRFSARAVDQVEGKTG
jgi:hypothetical protein